MLAFGLLHLTSFLFFSFVIIVIVIPWLLLFLPLLSFQCFWDDLKLQSGNDNNPCLITSDESYRIEKGADLRVKLLGLTATIEHFQVTATIKEDFLG